MILFFIVFGLIGAFQNVTQYAGIVLGVPVAIVVLLLYTQPIWTVIFGRFMLKELITRRKVIAVVIALAGIVLLLKPWSAGSVGSAVGIMSALLGGAFLSLWIIWGRKSGIAKHHYLTIMATYSTFAVLWLLLMWPAFSFFIHESSIIRFSAGFPAIYWVYLVIFALVSGVVPESFFFTGIQKIQASIAGIILLLEPVSAAILAWIFFTQPIGLNILSGGALILFSNYLVIHKK
jgi:drug/metabolite transporter (DMT)-like permease